MKALYKALLIQQMIFTLREQILLPKCRMIRKLAIASIILGESILALFIANLIVDHGYKDEPSRDLGSIMIGLTLGFTFLGFILLVVYKSRKRY